MAVIKQHIAKGICYLRNKISNEGLKFTYGLITIIIAAILIRSLLFAPFHIPSGSMKETLLEGDYIFASKYSYGYSKHSLPFSIIPFKGKLFKKSPKRGDVIIFRPPYNTDIYFVKRVIGLPGDKVQVILGSLYINNEKVEKFRVRDFIDQDKYNNSVIVPRYEEILPNKTKYKILLHSTGSVAENTGIFNVPTGHFFVMGDNRDESRDSRFSDIGYIPEDNIIGKAKVILFSKSKSTDGALPFKIRMNRLWQNIN